MWFPLAQTLAVRRARIAYACTARGVQTDSTVIPFVDINATSMSDLPRGVFVPHFFSHPISIPTPPPHPGIETSMLL